MSFDRLLNQESVKLILTGFLKRGVHNRTFLFFGEEGVGKFTAALLFAQGINCLESDDIPCFNCRPCHLMEQNKHPDLLIIERGFGNTIKLEESKRLREFANSTPVESRYKVVIIREAHLLTPEAGNSLLKTLEETPQYLTPILTTSAIHLMLPTIVSRSVKVQFFPLPLSVLKKWLLEKFPLTEGKAQLIAGLAQGNMTRAVELVNGEENLNQRRGMLEFLNILRNRGYRGASVFLDKWSKDNKEDFIVNLRALIYLIRDILLTKEGRTEYIVNVDLEVEMDNLSKRISREQLIGGLDYLLNTLKLEYDYNLNPALHWDRITIRLREQLYG